MFWEMKSLNCVKNNEIMVKYGKIQCVSKGWCKLPDRFN